MSYFHKSTSLSEIVEKSHREPVIIFKYSNDCGSSTTLSTELEQALSEKVITYPIYRVTVQTQPVLSKNIAEHWGVTHQSPQIIILSKGTVTYTAHHHNIKINKFAYTLT